MYEFFDFDYKNAVFEWDDNKADINFKKHGIRFETAVKIFADDNKLNQDLLSAILGNDYDYLYANN